MREEDAGLEALRRRLAELSAEERAALELQVETAARPSVSHPAADEVLVPVRTGGARRRLFFGAPSFGTLVRMRALVDRLDSNRPVDAVVPPERVVPLSGAGLRAHLVELAVSAIRAVQPTGPYLLGGYCFGGLYALEIGRALGAAGEEITGCVLLDAPFPQRRGRQRLVRLADLGLHHLRGLSEGGILGSVRYVSQKVARVPRLARGSLEIREWKEAASRDDPSFALSSRAFTGYTLGACPFPLHYLVAEGRLLRGADRRWRNRWQRVTTSPLSWQVVPGEHDTLLDDDRLPAVAGAMSSALSAIDGGSQPGGAG